MVAATWLPQADAMTAREQLRGLFDGLPYASCVPFDREENCRPAGRVGGLFRAAAAQPQPELLARIEDVLQLGDSPALR